MLARIQPLRTAALATAGLAVLALGSTGPASAAPISHFVYAEASRVVVFDLLQQPVPSFIGNNQFDVFHQTVFINNVMVSDVGLDFFLLSGGGGIETDNLPPGQGINEIGPQVFSGTLAAPMFVDGVYQLSAPPAGGPINATLTITTDATPAIPEPAGFALLGIGLLGAVAARRYKAAAPGT